MHNPVLWFGKQTLEPKTLRSMSSNQINTHSRSTKKALDAPQIINNKDSYTVRVPFLWHMGPLLVS